MYQAPITPAATIATRTGKVVDEQPDADPDRHRHHRDRDHLGATGHSEPRPVVGHRLADTRQIEHPLFESWAASCEARSCGDHESGRRQAGHHDTDPAERHRRPAEHEPRAAHHPAAFDRLLVSDHVHSLRVSANGGLVARAERPMATSLAPVRRQRRRSRSGVVPSTSGPSRITTSELMAGRPSCCSARCEVGERCS